MRWGGKSLLFLYYSLPGGEKAPALTYLRSEDIHPVHKLLWDEVQLSLSHKPSIILLVSIQSGLPLLSQLLHCLDARKFRLSLSFFPRELLLLLFPILSEQIAYVFSFTYVSSVV